VTVELTLSEIDYLRGILREKRADLYRGQHSLEVIKQLHALEDLYDKITSLVPSTSIGLAQEKARYDR
jgi:hypothetical protein